MLLCDLGGMGETTDKPELNDPKYFNREYRNALLALHTGESIVGQRVRDIGTALDFVHSEPGLHKLPVMVCATGAATLPALHALLFEEVTMNVYCYGGLQSFRTILDKPAQRDWYSYVIPGVLRFYDIPDLAGLVGRERVHFVH